MGSTEYGSVDDCMGMCDANADCTAFSYMKYSNQCRLEGSYFSGHIKRNWRSDLYRKRGAAESEVGRGSNNRIDEGGCDSFSDCSRQNGGYYGPWEDHHVIGSEISTESGSVTDCMYMCRDNSDCYGFSYMKDSNQCRLEGWYDGSQIRNNWGTDLYQKRDRPVLESEVGDYHSPMIGYHVIGSAISTESGSVDDCMGMCDADAGCTAFSYMKYSNQCRLEGSYFSGHIKRNWRSDLYRKRGAEAEVGIESESEVGDYYSPLIGYHVIGSAISTESGSVDDCMGMCDANT